MKAQIIWDLQHEAPTLGGLLTLAAEVLILENRFGPKSVSLECIVPGRHEEKMDRFRSVVVSHIKSEVIREIKFFKTNVEPVVSTPLDFEAGKESAYDLTRVNSFFAKGLGRPRLAWTYSTEQRVRQIRKLLPERLLAVHLRRTDEGQMGTSDADGTAWSAGLEKASRELEFGVVLIGDDTLDPNFTYSKNVVLAAALNLSLGEQLALVQHCDAFLGSASGIAASAVFSPNPYTIFKHPEHHASQMSRELGDSSSFNFATDLQHVYRSVPTAIDITLEALTLLGES
jgi:hypothetical protein